MGWLYLLPFFWDYSCPTNEPAELAGDGGPEQRESSEACVVQWACDFPAGVLRGSSATLTTSLSWCVPGSDRGGGRGNTHQLKFSSPKELPVLIGFLTVCVCVYAACIDAHWTVSTDGKVAGT